MEPGGDARWDEPPLDVQIPDDARELERDVLAYHRELRAQRRQRRLRRFVPAQAGVMPLIASILAVCLVAGMMLSVFTISPADTTTRPRTPPPTPRPTTQTQLLSPGSLLQPGGSPAIGPLVQPSRLPSIGPLPGPAPHRALPARRPSRVVGANDTL